MEYVNPEGLRLDGRRPRELRQLRCELGVLGNADGSAMFEMGNSKVVAGVFGPREGWSRGASEAATIRCEYNIAAFATGERRKRQKTDWRSMEEAAAIRAVLEQTVMVHLMPISQILVAVHVIQADGGARSAAINAAFMAAADAGIPMKDTVAACAAGWLSRTAVLDLNYVEEAAGTAAITVALHPGSQRVVSAHMDGSWAAVPEAQDLMGLAAQGCMAVVAFMRTTLLTRSSRLAAAQNLDSAL